jgi:hypothetical protein
VDCDEGKKQKISSVESENVNSQNNKEQKEKNSEEGLKS